MNAGSSPKVPAVHHDHRNRATKDGVETGGLMRDVRTCGEAPLHRAAVFGDAEAIKLLLDAGAKLDAKDAHGDAAKLGKAGTRAPTPSCACCYMATSAFVHSAPACANICRASQTSLGHTVIGKCS